MTPNHTAPARCRCCLHSSGDQVYLVSFLGCVSYRRRSPGETNCPNDTEEMPQHLPTPLTPRPPAETKSRRSPHSQMSLGFGLVPTTPQVPQPWEGAEYPTGSRGSDSQLDPNGSGLMRAICSWSPARHTQRGACSRVPTCVWRNRGHLGALRGPQCTPAKALRSPAFL